MQREQQNKDAPPDSRLQMCAVQPGDPLPIPPSYSLSLHYLLPLLVSLHAMELELAHATTAARTTEPQLYIHLSASCSS